MTEPGQKDLRLAWEYCDNEHGYDDPCGGCRHLARGFAAAREEGIGEGMTLEAINCHEHSQAAAKAERARIIAELREWAEREAYGGGEDDNGYSRCATIDLPEMLAQLDQMGRGDGNA